MEGSGKGLRNDLPRIRHYLSPEHMPFATLIHGVPANSSHEPKTHF